jgi:hypothetical protein
MRAEAVSEGGLRRLCRSETIGLPSCTPDPAARCLAGSARTSCVRFARSTAPTSRRSRRVRTSPTSPVVRNAPRCLSGEQASDCWGRCWGRRPDAWEAASQAEFRPGERRDRTQEVAGSSPASSTSKTPANAGAFVFHRQGQTRVNPSVVKFWSSGRHACAVPAVDRWSIFGQAVVVKERNAERSERMELLDPASIRRKSPGTHPPRNRKWRPPRDSRATRSRRRSRRAFSCGCVLGGGGGHGC